MKISLFNLFFSILTSCICVSCRLDKPDPLPEKPKCSLRLVLDRELEIEEADEPLIPFKTATKTSSDDLYAVQVYKKGLSYSKYGYGIFDDESAINLPLEVGLTYKIEVSLVLNGKNLIAKGINGGYEAPFTIGGFSGGPGKVTNQFVQSTSNYIETINEGKAVLKEDGVEYSRPPISRYYGMVEDYRAKEDEALSIPLKLAGFGLTIVPKGFTAGSIEVKMDGAPTFTLTPDEPAAITKKIFTFENFGGLEDWTTDDYSENIKIAITWTNANNEKITFGKPTTSYKIIRKTNKILTFSCGDGNGQILFDREDDTLTDDSETLERP